MSCSSSSSSFYRHGAPHMATGDGDMTLTQYFAALSHPRKPKHRHPQPRLKHPPKLYPPFGMEMDKPEQDALISGLLTLSFEPLANGEPRQISIADQLLWPPLPESYHEDLPHQNSMEDFAPQNTSPVEPQPTSSTYRQLYSEGLFHGRPPTSPLPLSSSYGLGALHWHENARSSREGGGSTPGSSHGLRGSLAAMTLPPSNLGELQASRYPSRVMTPLGGPHVSLRRPPSRELGPLA